MEIQEETVSHNHRTIVNILLESLKILISLLQSTNILILFAFLFLTECVQRFHYSSFLTIHSCSGSL